MEPRPPWPFSARDPYLHAAVGYGIYGFVYLAGASFQLTPERRVPFHGVPWWVFYVGGLALIAILPQVVLRWRPWAARILAFGPAAKALVLCLRLGQGRSPAPRMDALLAVVAVLAAVLLARAGWLHAPRAATVGSRQ